MSTPLSITATTRSTGAGEIPGAVVDDAVSTSKSPQSDPALDHCSWRLDAVSSSNLDGLQDAFELLLDF